MTGQAQTAAAVIRPATAALIRTGREVATGRMRGPEL